MSDDECRKAATEFVKKYSVAARIPFEIAIKMVMADDAGPDVKRGLKILRAGK